jgi:ABC-2 type transport system ATP-binding protein
MNEIVIRVNNLSKNFGSVQAVKNISFEVKQSEIFAFLGPNGAGKTTTIRMLITLLAPANGDAIIDGYSVIRHPAEVRKVIGYVPQMISVDGALTVRENLMLMARLYGVSYRECNERIKQMLAFLDLEKYARTLVRTLSGGMIRKLEVGQAMLHHPRLLFLDEPTTGLDPIAKRNIWKHLTELRDTFGTTIFFSTHNMEEADEACDKVAIMNVGEIVAIGAVSELKEKTNKKDATLEDAFIFFTGNYLKADGNFHEIRRTRQIHQRLG